MTPRMLGLLFFGMLAGALGQFVWIDTISQAQTTEAPAPNDRVLIEGHGRAYTSWTPESGEPFQFFYADASRGTFTDVPKGKKLVLTDVVYHPQLSVKEDITVNLLETSRGSNIMFQIKVSPAKSEVVSLCSGYSIESGKRVKASTDANAKDGQYISVSVTGYLIDESN